MDKRFIIMLLVLLVIVGCTSKPKFSPSTSEAKFNPSSCGFDNEKGSVNTIYCNNFRISSKGIEFGISSTCNAVKASDCLRINFNKLKISGTCNDEIDEIKSLGNRVCTSGLTTGQQVDIDLELSYTANGEQKTIKGKLRGKVE